jgi:hypothetical protein
MVAVSLHEIANRLGIDISVLRGRMNAEPGVGSSGHGHSFEAALRALVQIILREKEDAAKS